MSTTVVFACKSNSCRSQIAEGWSREWIAKERAELEKKRGPSREGDGDNLRRLRAFLDGLLVVSVALDESSVAEANELHAAGESRCITCDGEAECTPSISTSRRKPKQKAIEAMAQDGVDISRNYAKGIGDVLPLLADHHRRFRKGGGWKAVLSFAGMFRALEAASREMGMAFAGVVRDDALATPRSTDEGRVVDRLVVLCSCPDAMKRALSDRSRATLEWDVDPPSAAAKGAEGDGAYVRVSWEIRGKVAEFLDELKRCALVADDAADGLRGGNDVGASELSMMQ